MGQYHTIYNKTKKEYFRIGGAKLWEQSHSATAAALLLLLSNSNGRGGGDFNVYSKKDKLSNSEKLRQIYIDEVSGRWAGDEIVVQGDYAEEKDKAYISKKEVFRNITTEVCNALIASDDEHDSDVVKIIIEESKMTFGSVKNIRSAK